MKYQPTNLLEFQKRFPDEASCLKHLHRLRWRDGFCCPRCGHTKCSFIKTRRLYQCSACSYQASLTAGTVFHRTRTPIQKWFWLIFMMTRHKSGVSILRMQKLLRIGSYKTAWLMGHKIRKGMQDRDSGFKLAGLVELDLRLLGPDKVSKSTGTPRRPTAFVTCIERRPDKLGHCVMRVVDGKASETICDLARDNAHPATRLRVYGKSSYDTFMERYCDQASADLVEYGQASRGLRSIHAVIANIRGNIRGVYHGVSRKHLQRYFAEFCYRFNRRVWDEELFDRGVMACLSAHTVTFNELTL